MIEIIILLIIALLFIDYFHKQYRIKRSLKNISYRNSNSFYDDTDYSKYKPYKEIYTYKILIIFLITILILDIIPIGKSNSREIKTSKLPKNLINSIIYTKNEIDQYEIGTYQKDYGKQTEKLFTSSIEILSQNNFNNYDINKLNEEINHINSTLNKLNSYKPRELESSLHNLNIKILNLLKNKYDTALELKTNYYDNQLINSLNASSNQLNIEYNKYRIELIKIFNDINMNYKILDDGTINFTFKDLSSK